MVGIDRRSALALYAISLAAIPVLLPVNSAGAQSYGPDDGKEVAPGVRVVLLSQKPSHLSAYATISMRDMVFQPGSEIAGPAMRNDMVCHVLEGALFIDNGGEDQFDAPKGQVWACAKGQPETAINRTDAVAIMRIIDLLEG